MKTELTQWAHEFEPMANPHPMVCFLHEGQSIMFEPIGASTEAVKAAIDVDPGTVWSRIVLNGSPVIVPGYRAQASGYFITAKPARPDVVVDGAMPIPRSH